MSNKLPRLRIIERPPLLHRLAVGGALWRIPRPGRRIVYLTFDDGPIPEVTPWVLDTLDAYGARATFFMVGDNVRRNPALLDEVRRRGHVVGNHTMHHRQGLHATTRQYLRDVAEAQQLLLTPLFRPPHGLLKPGQLKVLRRHYHVVMHDVLTRDYSRRLSGEEVLDNVKALTRPGSIIVFHDSLKAWERLRYALPRALHWLKEQGYEMYTITL